MSENMHTVALHICGCAFDEEWLNSTASRQVVELAIGIERAGDTIPWACDAQASAWKAIAKLKGWRPRVDANLVARVAIEYIERAGFRVLVNQQAHHDILLALSAFSLECSPVYGRRIIDVLEAWLDETDNPGPYRQMKSAMVAAGKSFDAFGLASAA